MDPSPTARKTQLAQSSLILPALLQVVSLVHWIPFSGFFPLKHTSLGTPRVCWDPAGTARSYNALYPDSVLSKAPNQGTQMGCAFLSHIQSKSPDAAAAFRSVQSLNWHRAGKFSNIPLDARALSIPALACAGEQHPLQPPRLESWEKQPRRNVLILLPLLMETVNSR